MNKKKLERRIRWLWDNRTSERPGEESFSRWRYVPRAFSDKGPGWGVFDRLHERSLTDEEVIEVPILQLRTATRLQ